MLEQHLVQRLAHREGDILLPLAPLGQLPQFIVGDIVLRQVITKRQVRVVTLVDLPAIAGIFHFRLRPVHFIHGLFPLLQCRILLQLMLHTLLQLDRGQLKEPDELDLLGR